MSNARELAKARRLVKNAQQSLAEIERLPRRIGQQVIWSNGVVWTRIGDDQWRPWSEGQTPEMTVPIYRSAHVASGVWVHA